MNARKIVSTILLLFVVASFAYLWIGRPAEAPPVAETVGAEGERFYAYYFHGDARCKTCRSIETSAEETVRASFAAELEQGRLDWGAVNYDDAENEHYVQDFELSGSTLVLVLEVDGEVVRWQNLDGVWDVVGDDDAFAKYVDESTRNFLEGV